MSRCSFDTENALNGLFTKNGITKAIGNVGELLFLGPLNIILRSLIMVVMMSMRAFLKILLVVNLLSLREPCACWLSPSVVEVKEHVVQMPVHITD